MQNPAAKLPLILLAEDNPDDVFFMERALDKSGLQNPLMVTRDGQEAIDYLDGQGQYADRQAYPLPALLLLDIKMPRVNGFDVLGWLQSQPNHRHLKVVVLSTSVMACDIEKVLSLGADDYRIKSSSITELVTMLQEMHSRWLSGGTGRHLANPTSL